MADPGEYPETDDLGRRFRWVANHSTGKHVREYEPESDEDGVAESIHAGMVDVGWLVSQGYMQDFGLGYPEWK